tara:strand:- start:37954 stop:38130 length:177 start_codon:yes stop_codon:yes gene_type:complete
MIPLENNGSVPTIKAGDRKINQEEYDKEKAEILKEQLRYTTRNISRARIVGNLKVIFF